MCLDRKARFKPCRIGYKIVRRQNKHLFSEIRGNRKVLTKGVWLDEKDFRYDCDSRRKMIYERRSPTYPYGWHIFHSIEGAKNWMLGIDTGVLIKVSVKEPVATGYQHQAKITVAKQIKILGIVNEH